MTGYELLKCVKESAALRGIPVVIMSAALRGISIVIYTFSNKILRYLLLHFTLSLKTSATFVVAKQIVDLR
jgi:hypothetical protein